MELGDGWNAVVIALLLRQGLPPVDTCMNPVSSISRTVPGCPGLFNGERMLWSYDGSACRRGMLPVT